MGKWVSILGLVLVLFTNLSYGEELPLASTGSVVKTQRWGIGIHGGYFGVPDFILDEVFVEHPSVSGSTFGIEARYYGDKGLIGSLTGSSPSIMGSSQAMDTGKKRKGMTLNTVR